MMNHCLKTACDGSGYIHIQGMKPIKFEENGVFRYVKYIGNKRSVSVLEYSPLLIKFEVSFRSNRFCHFFNKTSLQQNHAR